MRWLRLLLLITLVGGLLPANLQAAWTLTPETVAAGDVVLMRWEGDSPPDNAVGRFAGQPFYFEHDISGGLFALLGVDIEMPMGVQMVSVVTFGGKKQEKVLYMPLRVVAKDRGVDRLTLAPEMVTPTRSKVKKRIADENALLKKLFGQHAGPLLAEPFRRPVEDPVSSRFGKKRILNGEVRSPHSGTDFRSPRGRRVHAPARGRVVYQGELYYTGNTVVLDHGAGLYSLYAHLEGIDVDKGQMLNQGEVLGRVGSSGRSTGPHLHWTVRLRNARIDPMSLLNRYGAD